MKRLSSNKKGITLVLEYLVGVVVSVVSLTIILGAIYNLGFLEAPENLQIARNNAQSIQEFMSFISSGDYEHLDDCYSILKLERLENFQFENEGKNYVLVLNSKGIYTVFEDEWVSIVEQNSEYYFNKNPNYKFKRPLTLRLDDTNSGFYTTIQSVVSFGSFDEEINLGEKIDYILLKPNLDGNQNNFEVVLYNFEKGEWNIPNAWDSVSSNSFDSSFLVYNNEKKELFIAANEISTTLVKKNLCSDKFLTKKTKVEFFKDISKIPYTTHRVTIDYIGENGESVLKFEWDGGLRCYPTSCSELDKLEEYFGEDLSKLSYQDFVKNVDSYVDNVIKISPKYASIISRKDDWIPKTLEEVKQKDSSLRFEDVFVLKYLVDDLFLPYKGDGSFRKLREEFKEKERFIFNVEWDAVNGEVTSHVIHYAIYSEGRFWFHIGKSYSPSQFDSGYFTFVDWFLVKYRNPKENCVDFECFNYIFNGQEVEIEKKEADALELTWFGGDNKNYYVFEIVVEGKKYDIVLSEIQFKNIEVFK